MIFLYGLHLRRLDLSVITQTHRNDHVCGAKHISHNHRSSQYAQELLQTFSTSLGEIALIPVTGGIFTITLTTALPPDQPSEPDSSGVIQLAPSPSVVDQVLWDRKKDGGFPETKELKNRVRNVIEPGRDLGHIDRSLKKGQSDTEPGQSQTEGQEKRTKDTSSDPVCKDCP